MSDFLSRLVLLSRGEAAVVKPRLPGRYEALGEAGPEEPGEADLQPLRTERPGPGQSRPLVQGGAIEPEPADAAPPDPDIRRERRPAYRLNGSGTRRGAEEPIRSGESPAARQPGAASAKGAWSPVAGPKEGAGDDARESRPRAQVPQHATDGQKNAPSIGGAGGDAAPVSAPGPAGADRPPPMRAESPLVPLGPPRPGEGGRLKALPAGGEAETQRGPDIHVTIGRVEVRAHTAAPRPAPRKPRPEDRNALSLQDYLKRGGGSG